MSGRRKPTSRQNAVPSSKATSITPFRKSAWEWMKSLAAGFVLFLVIRTLVVQTFVITSGSMEGTLLIGDLLVLNKVAYGAPLPGTDKRLPGYSRPDVGDVVVFRAHHEPLDVIKRIVGRPGDTLFMSNKRLFRNGVEQIEQHVRYSDPEGAADGSDPRMSWQRAFLLLDSTRRANYQPTRDNWGPVVVPANHYFLMGDNRDDSLDSRFWGFLSEHRMKGKAAVIYFSYDRESRRPFAWIREVRWRRIGDAIR